VSIRVLDRDGAPLNNLSIEGVLRWPTDSNLDRALSFRAAGDGSYLARAADGRAGRWQLRGRAEDTQGQAFDFEAELTWRR
jgi:nitrogen fixation protein FixH